MAYEFLRDIGVFLFATTAFWYFAIGVGVEMKSGQGDGLPLEKKSYRVGFAVLGGISVAGMSNGLSLWTESLGYLFAGFFFLTGLVITGYYASIVLLEV
ncbi:hypothetical protein OB920_13290 [Halobacteria archaeon HArc-gm2]|nr:hypothetical protein [Halobacteria archaeon HArc-gm2]